MEIKPQSGEIIQGSSPAARGSSELRERMKSALQPKDARKLPGAKDECRR